MVAFFGIITISVIIGYIIGCRWVKNNVKKFAILAGATVGIFMGIQLSFWGGSFVVKKEIVVEKYFISPMIIDGKPVVALMEEHDTLFEGDDYIFQTKDGDKIKLIKHHLSSKNFFFTCGDGEERYLEIRRSKTCRKNMWIWFFCGGTGILESKAVLKKGDNFLTLPRYYSL